MRSATLLLPLALALFACAANLPGAPLLGPSDPFEDVGYFREVQRSYTRSIRIGHIDAAIDYVAPEMREDFYDLALRLDGVRLTSFEIRDLDLRSSGNRGTALVRWRGYRVSDQAQLRFETRQSWRRDGSGGTWWVEPDLAALSAGLGEAEGGVANREVP